MATSVTLKANAIDISGTTSGTVTLQAPSVAGTTTITLPSTSGTLLTSASTATTSTNLAGGSNGTIPYQSASGTTQMLAVGTAGYLLQTNGAGAPTWVAPSSGNVTLTGTETLTNKTLTAPTIASANLTTALTLTSVSGTSGQVLTSAGTGSAPTWTTPAGGGVSTILATTSFPVAAVYDITSIPATYAYLVLQITGVSSDTAARQVRVLFSINNGTSFDTSTANYEGWRTAIGSNEFIASTQVIPIGDATAAQSVNTTIQLKGYQGGSFPMYESRAVDGAGDVRHLIGTYIGSTSAINAIRILWNSTGNFDGGTVALFGVR